MTKAICYPIPNVAGINWRRRARLRLSTELLDDLGCPRPLTSEWLHSALLFPEDVVVGTAKDIAAVNQIIMLVYGGDLPEVQDGQAAPEVMAEYQQIDGVPKFLGFKLHEPPQPMSRNRALQILQTLSDPQREAVAVIAETCEADGDYTFVDDGSVWCDDVQATLGVLADIYRTGTA